LADFASFTIWHGGVVVRAGATVVGPQAIWCGLTLGKLVHGKVDCAVCAGSNRVEFGLHDFQ
jgi:hypothetical protein